MWFPCILFIVAVGFIFAAQMELTGGDRQLAAKLFIVAIIIAGFALKSASDYHDRTRPDDIIIERPYR